MKNSKTAQEYYNEGNVLYKSKKYDKAIECYDEAIKLYPDYFEAYNNKGLILFDLKKYYEAIECYNKSIAIKPTSVSYNNKGIVLFYLEKYTEAIECYDKAIEFDATPCDIYNNKGLVLFKLKKYTEAIECYDKAINLNKNFFEAYMNKGDLCLTLREYEKSIKCYEESIRINKNYFGIYNNKGVALSNLKKYEEAVICYDKAIEILNLNKKYNKNIEEIYDNKGKAVIKQCGNKFNNEKYDEAYTYFEKGKLDVLQFFLISKKDKRQCKFHIAKKLIKHDNDYVYKEFINNIIDKDKKEKYIELYIQELYILNLLFVNEDKIAHYTNNQTLRSLLIDGKDEKFHLHLINKLNDPSEGKVLKDYLNEKTDSIYTNKGKDNSKEDLMTFVGSFTFNTDSLNQFRLYGKESAEKEATGVSIIFKKDFFNKEFKLISSNLKIKLSLDDNQNKDLSSEISTDKEEKLTLFRCIYIDPKTNKVISLGQKEKYMLCRDKGIEKEEEIRKEIEVNNDILQDVDEKLKDMQTYIKNNLKDDDNVDKILVDLRYLVKHVAFKEEQECRLIKVLNAENDKNKIHSYDDFHQLYIDYIPLSATNVEKVCFGPCFSNKEVYEFELGKLGIETDSSNHPIATF